MTESTLQATIGSHRMSVYLNFNESPFQPSKLKRWCYPSQTERDRASGRSFIYPPEIWFPHTKFHSSQEILFLVEKFNFRWGNSISPAEAPISSLKIHFSTGNQFRDSLDNVTEVDLCLLSIPTVALCKIRVFLVGTGSLPSGNRRWSVVMSCTVCVAVLHRLVTLALLDSVFSETKLSSLRAMRTLLISLRTWELKFICYGDPKDLITSFRGNFARRCWNIRRTISAWRASSFSDIPWVCNHSPYNQDRFD